MFGSLLCLLSASLWAPPAIDDAPPASEATITEPAPVEPPPEIEPPPEVEPPPDEPTTTVAEAAPVPTRPATPATTGPVIHASLADGFGIDSADGRFGVAVNMLTTLAYELRYADAATEQGFHLVYARPTLSGHLFGRKLRFAFQPAFDGPTPRTILAFVDVDVHAAFGVRAGVHRPFYTRGFIVGLEPLLLPDRGPVVSEFAAQNDIGVTVLGKPFDGKLEYYASVMNGEGFTAVTNVDPQPLVIGRVVVNPLGPISYSQTPQLDADPLPLRFGVGINAYTNETRNTVTITDPMSGIDSSVSFDQRDVGGGGELAMHWRMLSGQAEGLYRRRIPTLGRAQSQWGAYAQLGVFAIPRRLEPAMRISVLDLDDGRGVRLPIEPALAVYVEGNTVKLQASYRCDYYFSTHGCDVHAAVLQLQLAI